MKKILAGLLTLASISTMAGNIVSFDTPKLNGKFIRSTSSKDGVCIALVSSRSYYVPSSKSVDRVRFHIESSDHIPGSLFERFEIIGGGFGSVKINRDGEVTRLFSGRKSILETISCFKVD